MLRSIFILTTFLLLVFTSCDKPLDLKPVDNVAAITLSATISNDVATLNWTAIDHPGFRQYWLVLLSDDEVLIEDSLQLLEKQVLFKTQNASNTSFVDSIPILSDGDRYQVFAEISGRFVQSNTVKSEKEIHVIPSRVFFTKVAGGGGGAFFINQNTTTNTFQISRYDFGEKRISHVGSLGNSINNRSVLLYGDFGTGSPELLVTLNDSMYFFNPTDLTINYKDKNVSSIESAVGLTAINQLAIVSGGGRTISPFNRKTNSFGQSLDLPSNISGFITNFIGHVEGKQELILSSRSYLRYHCRYDQTGRISEIGYDVTPSPVSIFTGLAMDPQGEYFMPSRFGEIYGVNDLKLHETLPGDSTNSGNRTWVFSSSGDQIGLITIAFPATLFLYNRDDFSLAQKQAVSPGFFIETTCRIDGINYLVFRKTTPQNTFETVLSPLL
ncbi:MAG: hypothetical protein AB8F95_19815 [Bacteroidia bacterium]